MIEISLGKQEYVAGSVNKRTKEILLAPAPRLDQIMNYCHEVGHILGVKFSFMTGAHEGEVQQVLSLQDPYGRMAHLEKNEEQFLRDAMDPQKGREVFPLDKTAVSIGNKLLTVFSFSSFVPEEIKVSGATSNDILRDMLRGSGSPTRITKEIEDLEQPPKFIHVGENGDFESIYTVEHRQTETDAFYVEYACGLILGYNLYFLGLLSKPGLVFDSSLTEKSLAHKRAKLRVIRAGQVQGHGRVNSTFDKNALSLKKE